ncbi:hypothetical protein I79_003798 [Cricetulus griseus]|uniref:Uncharacterized protein n=1 Tax=Cricetulus griseus TaxID=10029 RepID=G3H0X8_CRIGR|nr:hypothetical protein I79_003798 [Cricetulus griseus]
MYVHILYLEVVDLIVAISTFQKPGYIKRQITRLSINYERNNCKHERIPNEAFFPNFSINL